jgi:hypothetical protein
MGPSNREPVLWTGRDLVWATLTMLGLVVVSRALVRWSACLVQDLGVIVPPNSLVLLAMATADQLVFLWVAWRFSLRKYRCGWGSLGFRPLRPGGLTWAGVGLLAGLVVNMVYASLLNLAGQVLLLPPPSPVLFQPADLGLITGWVSVGALLAPVAEETFFRGFVFGWLSHRYGTFWAAALSALLFALFRLQLEETTPAGIVLVGFLGGLLLARLYARADSLWPSILAHTSYNATALLVEGLWTQIP